MHQRFFKTSFGHEIPIVEDYRRSLPPPRDNAALVGSSSIQQTLGAKGPEESDFGIVSDVFQFAMMADWFSRTVASGRRYERMLDVGGSTGFIGQLFKATGHVRAVENIEVIDFSESLSIERARLFLRKIQNGRKQLYTPACLQPPSPDAVSWRGAVRALLSPRHRSAPGAIATNEDQIWVLQQLDHMISTYPFPIDEHSHYWRIDPDVELSLDRFILGDLFELDEKYDFLLVSTTMQHFSVAPFLEKAYALLEPGGILFIWNAYWYWVLIVNRVFGEFPWAVQRLTWDDFARYLKEYQPDQIDNARLSVEVFHKAEKRYTVNDYIAAGEAAGFRQLDHHRLVPFSGIKSDIGGWRLQGDHGPAVQKEVLRDIHCFRPDVELIDLSTQSVFLLFQKP
jgi:hypothetical protein